MSGYPHASLRYGLVELQVPAGLAAAYFTPDTEGALFNADHEHEQAGYIVDDAGAEHTLRLNAAALRRLWDYSGRVAASPGASLAADAAHVRSAIEQLDLATANSTPEIEYAVEAVDGRWSRTTYRVDGDGVIHGEPAGWDGDAPSGLLKVIVHETWGWAEHGSEIDPDQHRAIEANGLVPDVLRRVALGFDAWTATRDVLHAADAEPEVDSPRP